MTEEGAAAEAAFQQRKQARLELVAALAKEHGLPDHAELAATINAAEQAFFVARDDGPGGAWRVAEADALDFLEKARLRQIADRLEQLAGIILAPALGCHENEIYAVAKKLEEIAEVVADEKKTPRNRRGRGRGDGWGAHRPMFDILKSYWETRKGKFQQNQLAWDGHRPKVDAPESLRFAFEIIEHIVPGEGYCLKTIAQGPPVGSEYDRVLRKFDNAVESRLREEARELRRLAENATTAAIRELLLKQAEEREG